MAVTLGLKFDLSDWKKDVRNSAKILKRGLGKNTLEKFNRQVSDTAKNIRTKIGAAFTKMKGIGLAAFAGIGIAVGAVVLQLRKLANVAMEALTAFRQYSDSVTLLRAALESIGEDATPSAIHGVQQLARELRLALGIMDSETNNAFANFLTRGFDQNQAEQLTIIAANLAKKTGKPLADVQKQVADAANGSVDAMKELGIQIQTTGDRVKDAEAAVAAMKATYGDIGADLVNPSELLTAAMTNLRVELGEKLAPILEPLIQKFADFVTGLTETREGQRILKGIGGALAAIIDGTIEAGKWFANMVELMLASSRKVEAGIKKIIANILATAVEAITSLPLNDVILKKMGVDTDGMKETARNAVEAADTGVAEANDRMRNALGNFGSANEGTGINGFFNRTIDAGAAINQNARNNIQGRMDATAGETFAGAPAFAQRNAQQAAEAERQRQEFIAQQNARSQQFVNSIQSQQQRVASMAGNAGDGTQIIIRSNGGNRYRKASTG